MQGCRPSYFPMEKNLKLQANGDGSLIDAGQYRPLIGRLLYLTVTRPDIAYAVNVLSQFVSSPRQEHLEADMRVLRYFQKAPGQGILLPATGTLSLEDYCDADWGRCPTTRRSTYTTAYFILLGSAPISWKSKKEPTLSR